MAVTAEPKQEVRPESGYQDDFKKSLAQATSQPDWLTAIRKEAYARFVSLGFPTTRHEEWKYTNVSELSRTGFMRAPECSVKESSLKEYAFLKSEGATLVFVNGRFQAAHSQTQGLGKGVQVCDLKSALESGGCELEKHLSRYANFQEHPFASLNTAMIEDGACIVVSSGTVVEQPIHILHYTSSFDQPQLCHPRILLVANPSSQVQLVEHFVGADDQAYWTNSVTEIVAGENAVVDHYKVNEEGLGCTHVGTLHIQQNRNSNVSSHGVVFGGALVRNNIHVLLDGEGCDCHLYGLSMLSGHQHADNHLRVEHVKPHCNSREFYKNILDDHSHSVFTGRIFVHQDAQKTDGKQSNMNLLLSENALADSKPQLEIFADDVKCTHGATIGQIDDDAIFYLRSRGISEEASRNILIYAFANDSFSQIRLQSLKSYLERRLSQRLPQGAVVQEP